MTNLWYKSCHRREENKFCFVILRQVEDLGFLSGPLWTFLEKVTTLPILDASRYTFETANFPRLMSAILYHGRLQKRMMKVINNIISNSHLREQQHSISQWESESYMYECGAGDQTNMDAAVKEERTPRQRTDSRKSHGQQTRKWANHQEIMIFFTAEWRRKREEACRSRHCWYMIS
jgi:hypothetical protein